MNLFVKNKRIFTLTLMVLVHSHPYICVKINTAFTSVCLHYVSSSCFPTPLQTCIHPHAGHSDRTGSCLFVCIRAWLDWDSYYNLPAQNVSDRKCVSQLTTFILLCSDMALLMPTAVLPMQHKYYKNPLWNTLMVYLYLMVYVWKEYTYYTNNKL